MMEPYTCKRGHLVNEDTAVVSIRPNGYRSVRCKECIKALRSTQPQTTLGTAEKFRSKYEIHDNGCWIWLGGKAGGGYGRFTSNGHSFMAHRWSYEDRNGAIPDGLYIDHLCRNRACVNPEHLEPVTNAENTRRGMIYRHSPYYVQKTHCVRGHEYTAENTMLVHHESKNGPSRRCKQCHELARAKYVSSGGRTRRRQEKKNNVG